MAACLHILWTEVGPNWVGVFSFLALQWQQILITDFLKNILTPI